MSKILKVILAIVMIATIAMSTVACANTCTHNWVETSSVQGTCTVEGSKSFKCDKCQETKTEKTGFGEHTTKWAFDNEKHWKENTCEHTSTPDKKDHVLTNGVCECGYYNVTIENVCDNYYNLNVFKDGVNFTVVITHYEESGNDVVRVEAKDKEFYAYQVDDDITDEENMYLVVEGDTLYVVESGQALKYDKEQSFQTMFGDEQPTFKVMLRGILGYSQDLLYGKDGYVSIGENKWKKHVEEEGGDIVVTAKDGKLWTVEFYGEDALDTKVEFTYGNADLSGAPEVDKENAIAPGRDNIDDVKEQYESLKVFEENLNYTVTLTRRFYNDPDNVLTAKFDVQYNAVKAVVSGSGTAYMFIQGDTFYMMQGNSWQKADKDEFLEDGFNGKDNTIGSLIEMLYFYNGELIFPDTEYTQTAANQWTTTATDNNNNEYKTIITAKDGDVSKIEYIPLTDYQTQYTFEFTYGNANVGNLPTPDPNAEDLFAGGSTAPMDQLELAINKMGSIKAFDENNNFKVICYDYIDGEWISTEERWGVGKIIYSPARVVESEGFSSRVPAMWIIPDGNYVYICRETQPNSGTFNFSKMTEQDFAQNFDDKGQQSLDDYYFFDGAIWESAINTLYLSYGAEYHKVGANTWQSDLCEGLGGHEYIITTVTVNADEYLSEVLYSDSATNEPIQKYVYQYGDVVLPELPDYKNAN